MMIAESVTKNTVWAERRKKNHSYCHAPGLDWISFCLPPPPYFLLPLHLQGVISAFDYHRCCKELLGDDFNRIFNELLVLLPDTAKQQELLTAHGDCKATERQAGGGGGGKKNRNKKSAWQTPPTATSAAAELDCQVCPTCRQVLAPKDFITHKTLHIRDSEEFPSLQSISRIIS